MGSGSLQQDRVWIDATGKVWRIAEIGDSHLVHILEFLDDRAAALKEANVWRDYVNGPQPRGDMAQDAFEDEFMRVLVEPAHRWLHRQPLYVALRDEALRRDLIDADPPTVDELVGAFARTAPEAVDGCRCDDEYGEPCPIHVGCDRGCRALLEPESKKQLRAAVEHWRRHERLHGCSHGR